MAKIILTCKRGYEWVHEGNISFRGYLYDRSGSFLHSIKAARIFSDISSAGQLVKLLQGMQGAYSVIIRVSGGVLAASDPVSMFPLFYSNLQGKWIVSDSGTAICNILQNTQPNTEALPEFLSAGFVLGDETLISGLMRIRAGEVAFFGEGGKLSRYYHYYFLPSSFSGDPPALLKKELTGILLKISGRLIESLDGRTAVVPLSGGYDSRLIASMLKFAGYENTICFTYGVPGSESEISKKVADQLGFKWIFVDYREFDRSAYLDDEEFREYADYAGNASSMPYLQEYFAVKKFRDEGIVPEDSVFLPGHTGDYIAGSYSEKTIKKQRGEKDRALRITDNYFWFIRLSGSQRRHIAERIRKWFYHYEHPPCQTDPVYDVFTEDWDLKEKFPKFIFNSARVFPFFGYEFRLPLWDREFRSFFRKLPFHYRTFKNLYDEVIEDEFFKPLGVYFGDIEIKESPGDIRARNLGRYIRHFLPRPIINRRMQKRDYLLYCEFTREMEDRANNPVLPRPGLINSYNARICRWYASEVINMCTSGKGG